MLVKPIITRIGHGVRKFEGYNDEPCIFVELNGLYIIDSAPHENEPENGMYVLEKWVTRIIRTGNNIDTEFMSMGSASLIDKENFYYNLENWSAIDRNKENK